MPVFINRAGHARLLCKTSMARLIYRAVYSLSLSAHPFDGEKLSGVSLPLSGLPGYDEGLLPPGDSHKGDMGAT